MRVLLLTVLVVVMACVSVEGQGGRRRGRPRPRPQLPSRVSLTLAINDPTTIDKAMECIEGRVCKLDQSYAVMLRQWGPEIMMRGHCPQRLCSREEAREAKWLMTQIYQKYPKKYIKTVNRLASRNPYTYG